MPCYLINDNFKRPNPIPPSSIMSDDIQGRCLCGETAITVANGSNYKDQVCNAYLWSAYPSIHQRQRLVGLMPLLGLQANVRLRVQLEHRRTHQGSQDRGTNQRIQDQGSEWKPWCVHADHFRTSRNPAPKSALVCIAVTRLFCGNCGSAICHFSPAFGEAKAVQTGNFRYFADKPVGLERKCSGRSSVVGLVG